MKERKETELGAIWARVLIVSSGCPTKTWAAPPKLPAISSLTVSKVFGGMMRPGGGRVSKGELARESIRADATTGTSTHAHALPAEYD